MDSRKSSIIRGIRITHGFLGGLSTGLSDHLNCIIGARGTGKTSLIEFIRYALDVMPENEQERRRIEGIIAGNLAGGSIELRLTTCNGTECTVSRTQGEQPMLLDGNGQPTGKAYLASLFGIDIFSQNEVERIADDIGSQLALIESFDQSRLREITTEIEDTRAALRENARLISPMRGQIAELEDAVSGKEALEQSLKSYIAISGQGTKTLTKANADRAMRDRESKLIPGIQSVLKQVALSLKNISSSLDSAIDDLMCDDFSASPNAILLDGAKEHANACRMELTGKLNTLVQYMRDAWPDFDETQQRLLAAHQAQELQYNSIIEQCNADRNAIMERRRLERELDEMRKKEAALIEKRNLLRQYQEDRESLREKLSAQTADRYEIRKGIVDRINAAVGPGVRVTLSASSNVEIYRSFLVEKLKGNQMKYTEAIEKITGRLSPSELAGMLGRGAAGREEFMRTTLVNARQADIIFGVFKEDEARFELEMTDLPDLPTIELLDGENYKPTKDLSTGQKCNAILPILLLDSDRPLIIDQPEDNLDNAFIHSTVVRSIQAVKRRRQLIFVTHNPNIPVLGEAEQMLVLESNGTEGRLRNSGGIEHCKDDIVNLLEGGKEAFEKRKECYARIEKQQEVGNDGNIFF